MHKITKGLKKKKKGKKSKHKEEELFKPEELEAYRREHQATVDETTAPPEGQNQEEWKKFLALTSGVDDILKKTQGDLDRIKSTSFFQRKPTSSEVKKQQEAELQQQQQQQQQQEAEENNKAQSADLSRPKEDSKQQIGIVEVSESESEEEEDDDVFDTAFIDAIAAGEVKLAYIPESPTEQTQTGDDPFDTSIAERAILGPVTERKGKKLVPIGSAVEVLTGRIQLPTCAIQRPNKRQILKEKDLLLGSFDDNASNVVNETVSHAVNVPKTLLDDDTFNCLPDEPIDLSKNLSQIQINSEEEIKDDIINQFDVIVANNIVIEDEDDKEFALLAAESIAKPVTSPTKNLPIVTSEVPKEVDNWAAFENTSATEETSNKKIEEEAVEDSVDPFDTTFAENILPGKAELKIIENEILNQENDVDFNPRAENKLTELLSKVSIKVTDPTGQRESISSLDRASETDLNLITPVHRDLLGGSNTDLSNLNDQPLKPSEQVDENYIEYCDPFDTSIVETAKLPGQTELKFLEKELLSDLKVEKQNSVSDEDFDPRANENPPDTVNKERTLSRPDVLNLSTSKTVSFDIPTSPPDDLLNIEEGASSKITKPLTPFYVRKQSIPEVVEKDPFDTSYVSDNIAPGKVVLKLIEDELFNLETDNITDQNFDPRDEKQIVLDRVVQTIKDISGPTKAVPVKEEKKPIDLLALDNEDCAKALTPAASVDEEIIYTDPFDTSIASNILPGKTELKLIESELIHSDIKPQVKNIEDLLEDSGDIVSRKPLSPESTGTSFDNFDPFDTSIANNIAPGKAELKLLESELI